jgi:hypothetical protein
MGLRSVAAPVKDGQGAVIAAISILITGLHVTRRSLVEEYAPLGIMAADATSARLVAMVDRSPSGVVYVRADGSVTRMRGEQQERRGES